jgi:copper chaperone CopZ
MMPSYLHSLDGRLRVKVAEVKGNPEHAEHVEACLLRRSEITRVKANPITGNVLVVYDSEALNQETILDALRELGCFQPSDDRPEAPQQAADFVTDVLVQSVFSAALKYVVAV